MSDRPVRFEIADPNAGPWLAAPDSPAARPGGGGYETTEVVVEPADVERAMGEFHDAVQKCRAKNGPSAVRAVVAGAEVYRGLAAAAVGDDGYPDADLDSAVRDYVGARFSVVFVPSVPDWHAEAVAGGEAELFEHESGDGGER